MTHTRGFQVRYEYQSHWCSADEAKRGVLAAKAHAEGEKGWRVHSVTQCDDYDFERDYRTPGLMLLMERQITPPADESSHHVGA
jgi:hypothetical protein